MRTLFCIIVITLFFVAGDINAQSKVKSDCSGTLLKFNAFYSFYDTTKDNDGIPYFNRYKYITPFLFGKNGEFYQFPFSTNDSKYLSEKIKTSNTLDSGKYTVRGNEVIIEGYFTFYGWGMRLKKYKAIYQGTIIDEGKGILIKIIPPYPKINMRLNNYLKPDIAGKIYLLKED